MKIYGRWILIAGAVIFVLALFMDTSVPVQSSPGDRVNNLGLMQDQQNFLLLGGLLVLAGLIMYFFDAKKVTPMEEKKQCPQCAEFVQSKARICRFCNYEFTKPMNEEEDVDWDELARRVNASKKS